jgi:hypothetical protein
MSDSLCLGDVAWIVEPHAWKGGQKDGLKASKSGPETERTTTSGASFEVSLSVRSCGVQQRSAGYLKSLVTIKIFDGEGPRTGCAPPSPRGLPHRVQGLARAASSASTGVSGA